MLIIYGVFSRHTYIMLIRYVSIIVNFFVRFITKSLFLLNIYYIIAIFFTVYRYWLHTPNDLSQTATLIYDSSGASLLQLGCGTISNLPQAM